MKEAIKATLLEKDRVRVTWILGTITVSDKVNNHQTALYSCSVVCAMWSVFIFLLVFIQSIADSTLR